MNQRGWEGEGGKEHCLESGEGPKEQGGVNSNPQLDIQPGGKEKTRARGRDFRVFNSTRR